MNLKEFYEKIGGDYSDALSRLMAEERVLKYVKRFPEDPSFGQLKPALAGGDTETAFRAAHTIKGVAQNLAFTRLYEASNELTEALRPGKEHAVQPDIPALMARTEEEYDKVVEAVKAL